MNLEYITSELFIHHDLLHTSQQIIDEAKRAWEEGEKPTAYALAWPSKTVRAADGAPINRAIILELPGEDQRNKALRAFTKKTSAYGLLVLEFSRKEMTAIFESMHGTRSWHIPIERHGDRLVLGDQKVKDNTDSLGLLWSPHHGTS